jgi:regulating synaptic membrane exocytosis protein 2
MILQKSIKESVGPSSSATILGLKVVGGKQLTSGYFGALIEKVKKGSVADTVGHLLPGKYFVKFNEHLDIFRVF